MNHPPHPLGNVMHAPPPEEQAMRFHPCFGGYAACSGVNPCNVCQRVRRERVDSRAVVAAALNGMMLAAIHALAHHVRQTGASPEQILVQSGVDPNVLNAPPQRQVQAFWEAQESALAELHKEMDGGELAGQFMVTDTAAMPPQVVMPISRRYGQPTPHMPPPPSYIQPMPPVHAAAQAAQAYAAPEPPPIPVPPIQTAPPQHAPERPVQARPKPLTAEDIAAAAMPAASPSTPKSVNGANEDSRS